MSKKYKVICKNCGAEREITYKNPRDLCVKCAANNRKNCLKKDNFVNQEGRKRKAKYFRCPSCKEEKLVRIDHYNKTGFCQRCSARKLMLKMCSIGGKEHTSYKNGIMLYRKDGLEAHGKKCKCCESLINIWIHHIDGNRYNNEPENLLPLCPSCHCLLHHRLRKGLTHDEAIEAVKNKKRAARSPVIPFLG